MSIDVHLQMHCSYTNELIRNVLEEENGSFNLIDSGISNSDKVLYWLEYEDIDFDMLYRLVKESNNKKILANSYCIRKGLLRKANFALFVQKYLSKQPDSILRNHYPETHILDLSHPDYLDEALNEAFELRDILEENTKDDVEPIPFILKASILDKASELFIFYTQSQLEEFFTNKYDDDDDDNDDNIANVREWIVQRYIKNPKLLPVYQNRKFHLRVYVIAERNLRIYVYDGILALFASLSYNNDKESFDRLRHITNTCAQVDSQLNEDDLVKEFFTLENIDNDIRLNIFEQIKLIIKDIFTGLHNEITIFQPLKNAFEIYGFDFLIDENNQVYFLEANAYPDFKQTGNLLSILIKELFQNIVQHIILPYFGYEQTNKITQRKLHLVYDKQKTI
ncbi:unnamed protein product [Rotaria sp. Silwood1]|nr:unnamed protein product [Rotaria sp. Silwood1]CAF1287004.1 unnamed protein product [Rotaria sp. Silwood1]CAF3507879.1 unnamed protein product [Rotaria sp. Silwood1]CAF3529968.1 unnamed protein product [Rotaria sp. Silwood1]CAF4591673.1 unnamed protein product [Rotaria sp. Silwood1]